MKKQKVQLFCFRLLVCDFTEVQCYGFISIDNELKRRWKRKKNCEYVREQTAQNLYCLQWFFFLHFCCCCCRCFYCYWLLYHCLVGSVTFCPFYRQLTYSIWVGWQILRTIFFVFVCWLVAYIHVRTIALQCHTIEICQAHKPAHICIHPPILLVHTHLMKRK